MMSTAYITEEPQFHQLPHSMSLRVMPTIETSTIDVGPHTIVCDLKMAQQNLRVWIPANGFDDTVIIEMCSETGGRWQLIGTYDGQNPPARVESGHLRIYCEWRFGTSISVAAGIQPSLDLVWQIRP